MRYCYFLPFLILTGYQAVGQTAGEIAAPLKSAETAGTAKPNRSMEDVVLATLAIGFSDAYRKNYPMPAGFQLENTSGFAPIYGALEYGVSRKIGVEVSFCYDVFYANISRSFIGTGGLYKRNSTDNVKLFAAGVAAYYHLGDLVPVKKLDVFGGLGVALNNARHSNLPQGDTLAIVIDHFVSPQFRVGARYYITRQGSLFLNAGFDKKSAVNFGFSCQLRKNS